MNIYIYLALPVYKYTKEDVLKKILEISEWFCVHTVEVNARLEWHKSKWWKDAILVLMLESTHKQPLNSDNIVGKLNCFLLWPEMHCINTKKQIRYPPPGVANALQKWTHPIDLILRRFGEHLLWEIPNISSKSGLVPNWISSKAFAFSYPF